VLRRIGGGVLGNSVLSTPFGEDLPKSYCIAPPCRISTCSLGPPPPLPTVSPNCSARNVHFVRRCVLDRQRTYPSYSIAIATEPAHHLSANSVDQDIDYSASYGKQLMEILSTPSRCSGCQPFSTCRDLPRMTAQRAEA
jgi:hypothetical protein